MCFSKTRPFPIQFTQLRSGWIFWNLLWFEESLLGLKQLSTILISTMYLNERSEGNTATAHVLLLIVEELTDIL